jgi:hypothetical protein
MFLSDFQGPGTDENCLIEILASRTNGEIFQMREAYCLRKEIHKYVCIMHVCKHAFQITRKSISFRVFMLKYF